MQVMRKQWGGRVRTAIWMIGLAGLFFIAGDVLAASGTAPSGSVGGVADNVIQSLGSLAKLITATAYIAGMGFAIGAVLKFKAHKDNPQQIPVGTPIALIFIAAALIFLPAIISTTGITIFGSSSQAVSGGITGTDVIPGIQSQ